jgi:hypothetical protein
MTRRGLILAAVLTLVALLTATGCSVPGTTTISSAKVAAADGLLAGKYANAWWSDKFHGGKNEAPLIDSVQSTIGMDVSAGMSSVRKAADLARLTKARETVSELHADGVLSQADANTVLGAITYIEAAINKQ